MVALVWGARVRNMMCGGSIISVRHVLTAAHCIDPLVVNGKLIETTRGVVGTNQWNATEGVVKFSHFKNHPSWDAFRVKNDIGVLFLVEPLILSARVGIVSLSYDWVDGDVSSFVTGWGRLGADMSSTWILYPFADNLQLINLKTLSPRDCAEALAASPGAGIRLESELEICTFHSIGHGLCYGDSGSPLIERATGSQVGLASWALPCARGFPDVYARLSAYKNFLLDILQHY
ncbi:PREDICTED: trypsin beta-like [Papilio xuthus]|uniref:Trypsin beta-like n=1 Tax=Papilio xuthus TaxID=66420 RepID=A0AAJ6YZQ0_PAPXU|nr:PREDICTED: trypsin beta-like [Papilio xuthus]XP_013162234.1 PREDICTED: trypsin beta-like [Papilio xuthus]XP_013162235.1 PREDICTED: trypsin beta-like [Papilio xuthus]XP_013162236.1 PREDICTED: trypsin beta-like [Papilio xuthus]